MFHCKNSQICIHIEDVCNSIDDCPLTDDETMCNVPKSKCPEQCFCYNLNIQCTKGSFTWKIPVCHCGYLVQILLH